MVIRRGFDRRRERKAKLAEALAETEREGRAQEELAAHILESSHAAVVVLVALETGDDSRAEPKPQQPMPSYEGLSRKELLESHLPKGLRDASDAVRELALDAAGEELWRVEAAILGDPRILDLILPVMNDDETWMDEHPFERLQAFCLLRVLATLPESDTETDADS